jgi:glycosyltransferase involved in cell wall biosynthesis
MPEHTARTRPDRLRVMRVIDRLNVGGPALQAVALTHLDADGFESRLCVGRPRPDEGDYLALRAPHVHAQLVPGLGREPDPLGDARAFAWLVGEMRRFRPHLVHTHKAKAGVLGRLAARACRVPATVHTFHGHLLTGYFTRLKTEVVVRVERQLARRTTALVAVGAQTRDDLLARGIGRPDQFHVVPPGVTLAAPPPVRDARASFGLPGTGLVVGYVGRLTAVKRPDRFLDVAGRVGAARPDVTFLVVGDGDLLGDFRRRAEPLRDRVRCIGWRPDVETAYAACDVVVLTSDNEGMPVSLIEAAHAGRPVVTTSVGSAAEVVQHGITGFVASTEPDDITASVLELLGDAALRARMGAAAAEHASAEFSTARLVNDIAQMYENLWMTSSDRFHASHPG